MTLTTFRANATPDAVDVRPRQPHVARDRNFATTPEFFSQALRSLADRLGPRCLLVFTNAAGETMRVGQAQLYEWARLGPHGMEESEIPFQSTANFAMLCDDLSAQHALWRGVRSGTLAINQSQFDSAYVTPTAVRGSVPSSSRLVVDVNLAAPTVSAPQQQRVARTAVTEADAIARVQNNPAAFAQLPRALRNNPRVGLAAMSQPRGGEYMYLLPVALRDNDDIARAAIRTSPEGMALGWCSDRLRTSVAFVTSLFAGTTHSIDVSHAGPNVRANAGVRALAFDALIPAAYRASFNAAQRSAYLAVVLDHAPASTAAARDPIVAGALLAFNRDGVFDTAIGTAAMANVDTWIQFAHIRGDATPLIGEIEALPVAARAALNARVQAAGYTQWERFPSLADLQRTLTDFEHRNDASRPVLLLVASRDDHNRGLASDLDDARQLYPNYRIVYRESSSRDESLTELAAQSTHPAEIVIVTGHGNRTSITMGPRGTPHRDMDRSLLQSPLLAAARRGVARGAHVYTIGCANGEGGANDGNMVNTFAAAFPHAQSAGARINSGAMSRVGAHLRLNVSNARVSMYVVEIQQAGITPLPFR